MATNFVLRTRAWLGSRYLISACLPNVRDFLELEKEEIFRKEWICLGRVDENPNRDDYFMIELARAHRQELGARK